MAVSIFLIAGLIVQWVFLPKKLAGAQLAADRFSKDLQRPGIPFKHHTRLSNIAFIQKFLRKRSVSKTLLLYLRRAKWGISVAVFFLGCFFLAAICLLLLAGRVPSLIAIVLSGVAGVLPIVYLRKKNQKYIDLFCERLPEGLMTLSGGIKVGLSLERAIKEVVQNAPYPVALEFKIVSGEVAFGASLEKAVHNLYKRIPKREVQILATAIAIHNQLGGNLSEVLVNLQNTIRERLTIQREIHVLSAQGTFTSFVLVLVPVFVAGIWFFMDHENFVGFLNAEIGKWTAGVAVLSVSLAYLMIQKIIKVSD
ncbi:MAG: type II secretion system F family protein [Candidatus Omnitrophota bacterium]